MNEQGFRVWLIGEKGMQEKSARDVISRCRRIERTFGVSLEEAVSSTDKLNQVIESVQTKTDAYLKPGTKVVYGMSVVRRAAQLYAQYRSSQETGL